MWITGPSSLSTLTLTGASAMSIYSSIFLNNNSTIEYYNIIENAIKQKRVKLKKSCSNFIYYEAHHILPKCLFPEFAASKSNIVLLSAEEHYRCHKLLTEMTEGNEYHRMIHAFWCMATRKTDEMNRQLISEEEYSKLRTKFSISRSVLQSGKMCMESTKKLISLKNKGRKPSKLAIENSVNARLGKKKTPEAVKKSTDAQRGNTNTKGKIWWNNGVKSCMTFDNPGHGWIRGRGRINLKG